MQLTLLTLVALASSAYAGLENAKHVKVLNAKNFDASIREPEQGTLVAFYAPWCGHCKNLEGTWTSIGKTFDSDSKCNIAILDADKAENKAIGSRYGVSGFPTIKFLPSNGGSAIDYTSPRSEDALLEFLNKQCGSNRLLGGGLSELAGRLPSLDKLAAQFLAASTSLRGDILTQAKDLAASLNETASAVYLKTFQKIQDNDSYLKTEAVRIAKLLEKRTGLANKKIEELQIKSNILKAFEATTGAASDAADKAQNAASSASGAAQSAASQVSGAAGTASKAAQDAADAVQDKFAEATDRVKQEL